MSTKNIVFSVVLALLAVSCALGFASLLILLVSKLGMNWTIASVIARLLVLVLVTLSFKAILPLIFPRRNVKLFYIFLIALLPGVALSFVHPIYVTDYGSFDDNMEFKGVESLEKDLASAYTFKQEPVILAFFTTDCNHCKAVCSKLAINAKSGQRLPVHAFFSGAPEDAKTFLAENKALEFNYHFIEEDSIYLTYSGYIFPSIFLLDEGGNTVKHWEGDVVNYTALDYLKGY